MAEKALTHWKRLVNPDYIGAYSLEKGRDLTVEIVKVERKMVKGDGGKSEECTVAVLKGQKPFILNRTNSKMITKIYGTPYIEEWAGLKVTLYATKTKVAGEEVECLRIRPTIPALPELKADDKANFDMIKEAVKKGFTLDQIRTKWTISQEVEKLLLQ